MKGVGHAYEFIGNLIRESKYEPGKPLPSIKQIAAMADVSPVSAWKAYQKLKTQGIIHGGARKRFRIAENRSAQENLEIRSAPEAENEGYLLKWQRIQTELKRDILNGIFTPETPIPQTKELQARFGADYSTIRKALAALVDEGLLSPYRRSYVIHQMLHKRSKVSIALLLDGRSFSMRKLPQRQSMYDGFIRFLESECSRINISLLILCYKPDDNGIVFTDYHSDKPVAPQRFHRVTGSLIIVNYMSEVVRNVIKRAVRNKKRLAILDEVGGWQLEDDLKKNPGIQVFSRATSPEVGRKMARYLLNLKHRKIAYISYYHKEDWSQGRLSGLQEMYALAQSKSIARATIDVSLTENTYAKDARKIAHPERLLKYYEKWKSNLPEGYAIAMEPAFRSAVNYGSFKGEVMHQLIPHLERLLEDKSITAWVAAHDFAAIVIDNFLRMRGVKVPERVSVVSFDDTPDALWRRLTSYNFNTPAIVRAMLSFAMKSPQLGGLSRKRIIEIEGAIIERASAARAQ